MVDYTVLVPTAWCYYQYITNHLVNKISKHYDTDILCEFKNYMRLLRSGLTMSQYPVFDKKINITTCLTILAHSGSNTPIHLNLQECSSTAIHSESVEKGSSNGRNKPNKNCDNTINDSRFRPLVTSVKPCVSMATPVRWTCSSIYLTNHASTKWMHACLLQIINQIIIKKYHNKSLVLAIALRKKFLLMSRLLCRMSAISASSVEYL